MDLWQIILVIAGSGVVLEQVWEKVIVRLWRFIKFGEKHVNADPVLMEIATYFRPNGGTSLPETIQRVDRTLMKNCQDIETLNNKFDGFIVGKS